MAICLEFVSTSQHLQGQHKASSTTDGENIFHVSFESSWIRQENLFKRDIKYLNAQAKIQQRCKRNLQQTSACHFQEAMLHLQLPLLIIGIICAYQSPTGSFDQTICYQLSTSYQHPFLFTDHRSTPPFVGNTGLSDLTFCTSCFHYFDTLETTFFGKESMCVCVCVCTDPPPLQSLQYDSIASHLATISFSEM